MASLLTQPLAIKKPAATNPAALSLSLPASTAFPTAAATKPALAPSQQQTFNAAAAAFTPTTVGAYSGSPVTKSTAAVTPSRSLTAPAAFTPAPLSNAPKAPPPPNPLQAPGQNMLNPGYGEQAAEYTQNRLLDDPYAGVMKNEYNQTNQATTGEKAINQNLGTLNGPGSGTQYYNQVAGQFNDPFSGEQFTRDATQAFSPTGAAGAFNDQAQARSDQFTNYSGPQNAQGQYGQTAQQLTNGTQGEQGLGQIAGQYDAQGHYTGANNAQGQFQQNASSGPLAGQQFYDQVAGQAGTTGKYSDPNLAAGQYAQTQGAFGDLPTPTSADPFYDRAIQLGTQSYNQNAAGRGVYGSSEALSGVGNVITDLNAKRAQEQFGNEMSIAQENRNRQALLGEQARMGDMSSVAGFNANLAGLQTFGDLANQAGNQTLGQQTMLGNQARNADVSATDAFNQNLQGAQTYANINNQQASQQLARNELLGNQANQADTQALGAQNANLQGLQTLGQTANNADLAENRRYDSTTTAMNNADKTQLDRLNAGADMAFKSDASERADFDSTANAANQSAGREIQRNELGANIANTASGNDLSRLNAFNSTAQGAENQRQNRVQSQINATMANGAAMQKAVSDGLTKFKESGQSDFENWWNSEGIKDAQAAGMDQKQIDQLYEATVAAVKAAAGGSK